MLVSQKRPLRSNSGSAASVCPRQSLQSEAGDGLGEEAGAEAGKRSHDTAVCACAHEREGGKEREGVSGVVILQGRQL